MKLIEYVNKKIEMDYGGISKITDVKKKQEVAYQLISKYMLESAERFQEDYQWVIVACGKFKPSDKKKIND